MGEEILFIETEHGIFTENTTTGQTAQEVYQEWLDSKQIDICPPKTTEQKLEELVTQVTVMDEIIANLTLEVL